MDGIYGLGVLGGAHLQQLQRTQPNRGPSLPMVRHADDTKRFCNYLSAIYNNPEPNVNLSACYSDLANATTTWVDLEEAVDGYWASYDSFTSITKIREDPSTAANCPSSWATFGTWRNGRAVELNAMLCWPFIQESHATVLFSLPDWTIRSLTVNESTTRKISTSVDTYFSISQFVFNSVDPSNGIDGQFVGFIRNHTTRALDTTLLQRRNFDGLKARIYDVYGLAFAQVLNLQGWHSNTAAQHRIDGTATYTTYRLHQDPVSTRILQGLLIALMVCSVLSLSTIHLTNMVPRNPCSIAAQASFVCGSSILARLPPGTQWMDDKELDAVFSSEQYSMGWKQNDYGKRIFIIDIADQNLKRK